MKIGPKLTMSHVLMALAPVVLLAGALLYIFQGSFGQLGHVATTEGVEVVVAQASDALAAAATERLKVVHDSKQHEVEHIVEQMLSESSYLGRSTRTYEIFEGMKYYHDFGGLTPENTLNIASPTYSTLYDDANRYFGDFVDSKSYRELFLLCSAHGHVLYSYQKNSDLGANVGEGPLRDEGLGRAWAQVVETGQTCLVDYSRYSPAGGEETAFIAAPCVNAEGKVYAVVALEIPNEELDRVVNRKLGLGKTGDSFLVGRNADGSTSLRAAWKSQGKNIGDAKGGEFVSRVIAGEEDTGTKTREDGTEILVTYSPVKVAGQRWGLVTTQSTAEALAAVEQMRAVDAEVIAAIHDTRTASLRKVQVVSASMLLVFALLSGGLAWVISRNITRPLVGAVRVADAVSQGDLSQRLKPTAADEVGDLGRALDKMSDGLQAKADLAKAIAEGDLTQEVVPASDKDEFGIALLGMVEQLSDVLSGIQVASEQVTCGSKEIADSSTALSQGATEQAASLQEISASMTELGDQVQRNAEGAGQADQLSNAAREVAATGAEQMRAMTGAMDEISASSEEIGKIIKVIDDIAFQTNLLALNAAVEAARAGAHGKGFAVVAEEVRNLAGRSAKAARETAQLIEGSLTKVKNGNDIAAETAGSLDAIVESITRASDLIGEIASASSDQSKGIGEVSQGLAQIDQVTQQNTASSEETASASEELASQATTLQHLLSRFRLAEKRQKHAKPCGAAVDIERPKSKRTAVAHSAAAATAHPVEDNVDVIELVGSWGE